MTKINKIKVELLKNLKKRIDRKRFASDEEIKITVGDYFSDLNSS